MYIIAGLGNPEIQYGETRHNVGFKALDVLAAQLNINISKKKFRAFIGEGSINGEKIVLVKPQTYMNLSGESIYEAVKWHKIPLSNLIIIYDDVDLPVGKLRIKAEGGPGTHNGMRSVVDCLETEEFPRIRIGIGVPSHEGYDLADYVLGRFSKEEKPEMEASINNAAEAVKIIVRNGIQTAMNRFNG